MRATSKHAIAGDLDVTGVLAVFNRFGRDDVLHSIVGLDGEGEGFLIVSGTSDA